jgi:hypothetical protein
MLNWVYEKAVGSSEATYQTAGRHVSEGSLFIFLVQNTVSQVPVNTHLLSGSVCGNLARTGVMRCAAVWANCEVRNHKYQGSNPHDKNAPTKPARFASPGSSTQVCDRYQTGERCDIITSGYQPRLGGSETEPALYGCDNHVHKTIHNHSCKETTFCVRFQQPKSI